MVDLAPPARACPASRCRGGRPSIDKTVSCHRGTAASRVRMPSVARRSLSSGTASLRSARTGRSDVVAITKPNGWVVERVRYDAYGRPGSFTPADLTGNAN
ncbi:MAG: hypothetical protein K2Q09_10215, partial [Phycisphaerales bacterium]|nr:hypothetical protein [Phycisphaerales bacterium]